MLVMKKILFGSVILVLLLIFFISYQGANNATVQTKNGPISGKTEAGVRIYLGIPFAAPPVGDLRWKPPQPFKSCKKVRDCTEFGPACPQPKARPNLGKTSEDCLYLNVWTPAKSADEKLAVMVFIHGGAFLVGAGSEKIYDPINIVKKGVVAVTINYRLGPFGFLAHPLLAKESPHGVSGNYGFIDQVAALKWVKQNIAAFGGNPNNVTIFGESAGALSIATHMISPLSKGLFHRAICESGAGFGHHYLFPKASGSMREALETGKQAEKLLGADTLGAMRAVPADELLKKINPYYGLFDERLEFQLVYDGWVIPDDPAALLSQGKLHDVPIIVGSNADEGSLFLDDAGKISAEKYKAWLKDNFGDRAKEVFALFPAEKDEEIGRAYTKLLALACFAEPGRYLARSMEKINANAYLYQFTRIPNTEDGKQFGAYHGIDLGYVFGNLDKSEGYDEKDFELSNMIMDYWVTFAKTGNPNGPGRPNWPAYDAESDHNIEFGDEVKVKSHLLKKAADLFDKINCQFLKNLR